MFIFLKKFGVIRFEIFLVRYPRIFIPFACEDAFCADAVKRVMKPSYPGK